MIAMVAARHGARALTLTLLAACASGRASSPAPQPAAQAMGAPREAVWDAALRALADRSIPVKTSDKASGLITTEEVMIPAAETKAAGECAKGAGMTARPGRAQYTILVSGDSTATVRVSSRLTWYNMYGTLIGECASSGALEARLAAAIRDRVGQP